MQLEIMGTCENLLGLYADFNTTTPETTVGYVTNSPNPHQDKKYVVIIFTNLSPIRCTENIDYWGISDSTVIIIY